MFFGLPAPDLERNSQDLLDQMFLKELEMVLKVGTIGPDTSSRTHTCAGEPDGMDAVDREHEAQDQCSARRKN